MKLLRLLAEVYESDTDDWQVYGSVLLPADPTRTEMEHALAVLGLYCPRGADTVCFAYKWETEKPFATISDANNEPMVRLIEVRRAEGSPQVKEAT